MICIITQFAQNRFAYLFIPFFLLLLTTFEIILISFFYDFDNIYLFCFEQIEQTKNYIYILGIQLHKTSDSIDR